MQPKYGSASLCEQKYRVWTDTRGGTDRKVITEGPNPILCFQTVIIGCPKWPKWKFGSALWVGRNVRSSVCGHFTKKKIVSNFLSLILKTNLLKLLEVYTTKRPTKKVYI